MIASGRSNQAATSRLVDIRKCLVYTRQQYVCPRVSWGNPSIHERMHLVLLQPWFPSSAHKAGAIRYRVPIALGDRHLAAFHAHGARAMLRRLRPTLIRKSPGKTEFETENHPWWGREMGKVSEHGSRKQWLILNIRRLSLP